MSVSSVGTWLGDTFRDFFNPGAAELNVPPLEGPLKPNDRLDAARVIAEAPAADNLVKGPEGIVFTSGSDLWQVMPGDEPSAKKTKSFEHTITALCALKGGGYAMGLEGQGVTIVGGPHDGLKLTEIDKKKIVCVTDLAEINDRLWITEGSTEHTASEWLPDLLGKRRTGRVSKLDLAKKSSEVVGSGLGWPAGVAKDAGGDALVSLAWEHRLARFGTKSPVTVWRNMPGYAGRLRGTKATHEGGEGGYWLSMFAMRTKLVEFVLQEDEYRMEMMRDIEPKYWVGPALATFEDHWEPLQFGGIKQLGMVKPWAPPRSYGLVVRISATAEPIASLHSRSGAHRHGITSAIAVDGDLYTTSKGHGLVLVSRGVS